MLGLQSACEHPHPRRCALDGHPCFHPANDAQKPGVARGSLRKTRAVRHRHVPRRPKGSRRVGHGKILRHHANHSPVAAFNVNGPPDELRIGAEGLPQAMTQDDDRFAAGRLPRRDGHRALEFVRKERAPKLWLTAIHVEETAGDMHARDRRAAVASPEGGRDRHHGGDRIERIVASDPVDDIAWGRPFAQAILTGIRFPHRDKSIRLIVRQRSQQHRVNKREERRRRSDTECKEE